MADETTGLAVEKVKEEEGNGDDNFDEGIRLAFISASFVAMKPRPRSRRSGSSFAIDVVDNDADRFSLVCDDTSPRFFILSSTRLPRD